MLKHCRMAPLIIALSACVSCAGVTGPFASTEDAALKAELTEALGQHYMRTMHITVSGGRVYMTGELRDRRELLDAMSIIRSARGVTDIMEDVFLIDVGQNGGENTYD